MSNDLIKILLQAEIDPKSVSGLKKQLDDISKDVKPIKSDLTGEIEKTKQFLNANKEVKKIITETTDKYEQKIKVIETLNAKTNEMEVKEIQVENNKKKLLDDWTKAKDRHLTQVHQQAVAENKMYDSIIKKEQDLKAAIEGRQSKELWGMSKEKLDSVGKTPDGVKQLNDHYKELSASMNKAHNDAIRMNKEFDKQQALSKTLVGNFASLKGEQQNASNVARALSEAYGGLEVRGMSLNKTNGQYSVTLKQSSSENLVLKGTIDQVSGALRVQSEQVLQARNVQLGFWDQMKIALERVPIWLGATTVYFQTARLIKGTVDEIKELNKEMISLERVSSASLPELERFFSGSPKVARELGVLTSEVINTTAEISKLGYSLDDSEFLTKLGLIGKTVGDLDNTKDAVDYLTSAIKGFRLETQQADEVLDYMNHTANTTSIDFAGIGEGYKRMSAAMSEANNSIEESTGLLVAGYDIVRNSEQVATALRTTSLRIRGVSEDGEKLGGLIPKLESDFNKFGLSLKKDNDTFKSTFEILKDIASIQDNITDMEQADLLEALAGKRNAQVIAAVISNMEAAISVSESFAEAQGSALIEHEKYMKGVEAAQNNVSAAMSELHMKLLDDSTIITVLNLTTSLIDNITALGKWNYAIVAATAGLFLFISTTKKMILANEAMSISTIGGAFKSIAVNIIPATRAMFGMKSAMDATTVSASMLNMATGGIILAIGAISLATGYFIRQQGQQREEMEKSLELFERQKSISSAMEGLISTYEELSNTTERTVEEQQRLLDVKEKITELLPESKSLLEDETLSIDAQTESLKLLTEEELRQAEIRAAGDIAEYEKRYENASKVVEQFTENLINLRETQSELVQKMASEGLTDEETKRFELLSKQIKLTEKTLEDSKMVVDTVDNAYKILNGTLDDSIEKYDDLGDGTLDARARQLDQLEVLAKLTEKFEDITSKIQTYNVFLDELNSKEGLSAKSKQEMIIKHQELLPYIDDEKELRKQLIQIIEEEERAQKQAYLSMIADNEAYYNSKIRGNAELVSKLEGFYQVDLANAKSLAHAKELVESRLVARLSSKWGEYFRVVAGQIQVSDAGISKALAYGGGALSGMMTEVNALNDMASKFDDIVIKGAGISFSDINMSGVKTPTTKKGAGTKKDKKGTTKKEKEEYKAEADAYAKINLELDRNNVLLQLNKTYQDQAGSDIAKKIKLMDEEIELNEERQDLLHQYNTIMRTEAKLLQKDLAGIFKFEGSWDDNSMTITNMDAIEGKGEDIEKKFKRIVAIMGELPKGSQEWTNLNGEIQKIELDKLVAEFKLADKAFEDINKSISDLEYELKMLEPDDFNGKIDNNVKTLAKLKEEVEDTTKQLEELGENGFEAGTKKSDAFIARQVELTARLKEGRLAAKEYERSLVDLIRSQTRETIEAEKRNAYMDLDLRQRRANEQFKADRERMDSDISRKQSQIDSIQSEIDEIQESERARTESLERSKRLEEISKLQDKYYHLQYVSLGNITEEQAKLVGLEKEREQYLERQTKLQELQIKLTNLQNEKNIQQLTKKSDGTWDFEYVADQKAIDDVNKQVEDLQKEHSKTIKDLKEQTLNDLKKAQESYDEWERQNDIRRQIEAKQRRIKDYQDEIKDLQDKFAEKERISNEEFAKERQALDDHYTDIDILTDKKMIELYETFDGNWIEISKMLVGHFGDIRSEYESLVEALSTPLPSSQSSGGGGSGGGGGSSDSSSSGGSSRSVWMVNPSTGRNSSVNPSFVDNYLKKGYTLRHKGGIVGDGSRDLPEIANQLFNTKPNEQMVKALKGELFIPEENISKNFLPNLQSLVDDIGFDNSNFSDIFKSAVLSTMSMAAPKIPQLALSGSSGEIKQNVTIREMVFPNVRDAKEIETSVKTLSTYANQWANRN